MGSQEGDDLVVRERARRRGPRGRRRARRAQSALRTASSVASTVAAKSGSSSRVVEPCRAAAAPVENGEEDLAAAVVGDRARARQAEAGAARDALELLRHERRVGGDDGDAAAGRARAPGSARVAEQARRPATPSMRSVAREPKLASTSTPTVARRRDAARRADAALPVEARSCPCRRRRAPSATTSPAARGERAAASAASTWTTRASLSQLSSHSPTTGMTTSSTPTAGSAAHRGRDGAVVDAADRHRRGQVDRRLDHAPLGDLQRAGQLARAVEHRGAGRRAVRGAASPGAAGTIAVTPVRATPRPAGGSGSSRTTVTWPTPTPATSAIASVGPGSSSPIRRPSARRRGRRPWRGH